MYLLPLLNISSSDFCPSFAYRTPNLKLTDPSCSSKRSNSCSDKQPVTPTCYLEIAIAIDQGSFLLFAQYGSLKGDHPCIHFSEIIYCGKTKYRDVLDVFLSYRYKISQKDEVLRYLRHLHRKVEDRQTSTKNVHVMQHDLSLIYEWVHFLHRGLPVSLCTIDTSNFVETEQHTLCWTPSLAF